MKELQKKENDKIVNVKQVAIEKQTILLGTARPKRGHTMFEYNFKEKTIVQAVFDELPAVKFTDAANGIKSAHKKITKKQDCIYVSALNKKNALKVLKRDLLIS